MSPSPPSPRYIAVHFLMPTFLAQMGGGAVLDAIERQDADFFIPVWMRAGFRFTPRLFYTMERGLRVGVMVLPNPREIAEAYMAVVLGREGEPGFHRYFLLEKSAMMFPESTGTMICSWMDERHVNHGAGPPFTGDLGADVRAFVEGVLAVSVEG